MPQNKDGHDKSKPGNGHHSIMRGIAEEKHKGVYPERDDTGYISPYRRRLQRRVEMGNSLDSRGQRISARSQREIESARAQLSAIHSKSKKKDGGTRGRSNP